MKKLKHIYLLKHDWMQSLNRDSSYIVGFATTKQEASEWLKKQTKDNYASIEVTNRREKVHT